jgi:uncharacterized membrane protein
MLYSLLATLSRRFKPVLLLLLTLQNSVWGSGAAGAFCAVAALATRNYDLWQIGFVASFTSKLSDTVSSEIGKVSWCFSNTVVVLCLSIAQHSSALQIVL